MLAYKGFNKDLTCLGYQFKTDTVNITDAANCRQNGFHCAENPLDCLSYYRNPETSVYYAVEVLGDIDEDGTDSKISCTMMKLINKLHIDALLVEGAYYMIHHPYAKWADCVHQDIGSSCNGYVIVRGLNPICHAKAGDRMLFIQERENGTIKNCRLIPASQHGYYNIDGEYRKTAEELGYAVKQD